MTTFNLLEYVCISHKVQKWGLKCWHSLHKFSSFPNLIQNRNKSHYMYNISACVLNKSLTYRCLACFHVYQVSFSFQNFSDTLKMILWYIYSGCVLWFWNCKIYPWQFLYFLSVWAIRDIIWPVNVSIFNFYIRNLNHI